MKKISIVLLTFLCSLSIFAQDSIPSKKEVVKKGWSFGALPAIAFDTDMGFRYGGLTNFFDFGDGTMYPNYKQSIYMEWSHTTKGNDTKQLSYDSEYLIPKTRVSADLTYITENALDFYGFNGYESTFTPEFAEEGDAAYRTRIYYRHARKMFRLKTDFQINIIERKLRLYLGYAYYSNRIDSVDINTINKGKDEADMLSAAGSSLYANYLRDGVIPQDEAKGGDNNLFRVGLVYDTRDREVNPSSGIWAESFVQFAPNFLGNKQAFTKFVFTWRQYISVVPQRVIFAYRLDFQPKIGGDVPWYMLPYVYNTLKDRDGFGGGKNGRGILRNRVAGEGLFYGNIEIRTVPYRTVIANQNFYIGLVPFLDFGMVTQNYKVATNLVNPNYTIGQDSEGLHSSAGLDAKFVINDNFVVSVAYGVALDKRDGTSGMYIGLNYLF
ncbi:MAG: hypothetical protein RIS47_1010, partial [Bacteroidota bacterium]|jgi:outer membrane protein assembly factor BamA